VTIARLAATLDERGEVDGRVIDAILRETLAAPISRTWKLEKSRCASLEKNQIVVRCCPTCALRHRRGARTGFAESAAIGHGHLDAGMQVMAKPFVMAALANKAREPMES
jgi:hypothetical protein